MMQEGGSPRSVEDDFVEFHSAGEPVKGEFHCSECGYGVTIVRSLPLCPMCGGTSWEQTTWSPFSRSTTSL
jgi:rubrerythrin